MFAKPVPQPLPLFLCDFCIKHAFHASQKNKTTEGPADRVKKDQEACSRKATEGLENAPSFMAASRRTLLLL